jgi:uncharacterized protein
MVKYFLVLILLSFGANAEEMNIAPCEKAYKDVAPDALEICIPYAEDRSPAARRMLGDMYYWGWGGKPEKDYKQAMVWYKRAVSDGDIDAKYHLGVMYEKGYGDKASITTAFKWYLSAAKDGHRDAQYNVANLYNTGRGIDTDMDEAFRWYLRSAKQGMAIAQYNLANRYVRGKGVEPDLVEAYKWYYLAAKASVDQATTSIAAIQAKMTAVQISQAQSLADKFVAEKE